MVPLRNWFYTTVAFLSISSQSVFADSNAGVFDGGVTSTQLRSGNITFSDIPKMILAATNFILEISSVAAFVVILIGAFKWALAGTSALGGGEAATSHAKDTIKYGLIGFVITSCAWLIVRFIFNIDAPVS